MTALNWLHRPTGANGARSVLGKVTKLEPVLLPTGKTTERYETERGCRIFVDRLDNQWGLDGWHMSISHPKRYPTWDEVRDARYALIPADVTMAMILPPPDQYINHHANCFQIHEIPGEGVHA